VSLWRRLAVALALVLAAACASSSKNASIRQIDDLLTRVERVHLDSELAQERMRTAVDALHSISSPGSGGDPAETYDALVEALEGVEEQAEKLRDSAQAMEDAAAVVFERWSAGLDEISSPNVRRRSEQRLHETRQRYRAILVALEPAQVSLDMLGRELNDIAVFLAHDLNPASLSAIEAEVRNVTRRAATLDGTLAECRAAAEDYVKSTALPSDLEVSRADTESRDQG